MRDDAAVRADWEQRIHERTDFVEEALVLPAPTGLTAKPGVGHVLLHWDEVGQAAGYVIERTPEDGRPTLLRHGGSDVAAVPGTLFASTNLVDGVEYQFRVAATVGPEQLDQSLAWSSCVACQTFEGEPGDVNVLVSASDSTRKLDRVWRIVGSERLSQLTEGVDQHGNDIGAEFLDALRTAHDDLGVTSVRAHAIFHDDLGVVHRSADGSLSFNFSQVDAIYDKLLEIGLRPFVELSFMPAALALDPEATVFTYRGIISPPKVWNEWHELVREFVGHLVDRYGIDEVVEWDFEVWNEPNLSVFWTGSRDEYFRLYDEAARAVKSVDSRLRVGGPASAASGWVEALAAFAAEQNTPLDFVSTHTYGNMPLDLRPALERHGFADVPIWWTEWGVGSTHFGAVHDAVAGAAFMLSGYAAVQGRLDGLAYWVISDHFEELGRPPRLFHDGFGLLTVGNLRKPRYWAAHLAAHQGDDQLSSTVSGDGANALVQTSATRHTDGTIDVLIWNGTINTEIVNGDPRLERTVRVSVTGLSGGDYDVHLARVDETHSNIVNWLTPGVEWPDRASWRHLREHDALYEERLADCHTEKGEASFHVAVPLPGIVRLRLSVR